MKYSLCKNECVRIKKTRKFIAPYLNKHPTRIHILQLHGNSCPYSYQKKGCLENLKIPEKEIPLILS